eukprot:6308545-Prymnesium_polylepis.1
MGVPRGVASGRHRRRCPMYLHRLARRRCPMNCRLTRCRCPMSWARRSSRPSCRPSDRWAHRHCAH